MTWPHRNLEPWRNSLLLIITSKEYPSCRSTKDSPPQHSTFIKRPGQLVNEVLAATQSWEPCIVTTRPQQIPERIPNTKYFLMCEMFLLQKWYWRYTIYQIHFFQVFQVKTLLNICTSNCQTNELKINIERNLWKLMRKKMKEKYLSKTNEQHSLKYFSNCRLILKLFAKLSWLQMTLVMEIESWWWISSHTGWKDLRMEIII